ncbi:MAG TPA: hypothetical protein VJZ73_15195, partial [Methylomirabilota bacterium]|nr:hypothetical protein [Methylomirabilota bacterium]
MTRLLYASRLLVFCLALALVFEPVIVDLAFAKGPGGGSGGSGGGPGSGGAAGSGAAGGAAGAGGSGA